MNKYKQFRVAVDACRPGYADWEMSELAALREQLDDQELRAVLERSQQFDAWVQEHLHDVEVPEGLADRLLAGLSIGALQDDLPDDARCAPGADQIDVDRRFDWRTMLALAMSMAAVVAFVVALTVWDRPREVFSAGQLQGLALSWPDEISSAGWRAIDDPTFSGSPPNSPLGRAVRRWKVVELPEVSQVIGYQLPGVGPAMAYLFEIPARRANVSAVTPPRRPFATQGVCVGIWKQGSSVYVLVVKGERAEDHYLRMIQTKVV